MMVVTQEMLPPQRTFPLRLGALGVRSVPRPAPTARRVRAAWLVRSLRGQR